VVSVLAIGLGVLRLKPGRGLWILSATKIRSTPSFGGEVKPSAHVVTFYGVLKTLRCIKEILLKAKSSPVLSALLLDESAGRVFRELVWMNQFSLVDITPPWLSMLLYYLGNEQ
jgi:predicted butyrate kinase (DUF1464 family)